MKRGILVLFLVIFLSNFVIAADVAYVLRNPDYVDSGFMDIFNEMNLEVDFISNQDIGTTDFSGYKFIFIGDDRLRNVGLIPVNDYPSVIANGYYGEEFGLTNAGGISRLASNSPLKIKKDAEIIQVYGRASFKLGGIGLPYYYLSNRYKKQDMQTIATTFIGYNNELGDVISYSTQGPSKCFFGITKAKFWTQDAKDLFKECVEFVTGEERVHDVEIIENHASSINGIRIKDRDSGEYLLDEVARLECNKKYKIDFKTVNIGDFIEDITFTGKLADFEWTSTKKNLEPGKSTTTGSKTINMTFVPGFYNINITAEIQGDIDLTNNFRSREVEVVCE